VGDEPRQEQLDLAKDAIHQLKAELKKKGTAVSPWIRAQPASSGPARPASPALIPAVHRQSASGASLAPSSPATESKTMKKLQLEITRLDLELKKAKKAPLAPAAPHQKHSHRLMSPRSALV
jgi:uncharacterized small protein (DUF1192 family)